MTEAKEKTIFEMNQEAVEIIESIQESLIQLSNIYDSRNICIALTEDEGEDHIEVFRDFVLYGNNEAEDVVKNIVNSSDDMFWASHAMSSGLFAQAYSGEI